MTATRTTVLSIVLMSMTSGCTEVPEPASTAHRLACEDGRSFALSFDAATDSAALVADGNRRLLMRLPSGSGARYGDGGAELWVKEHEAVLSEGLVRLACHLED